MRLLCLQPALTNRHPLTQRGPPLGCRIRSLLPVSGSRPNPALECRDRPSRHPSDAAPLRRRRAAQAVIQEIDDLDEEQSPAELMLSYVSEKSSKDRADRELVAPWFKFLWETYRNVLEILRNNVKFTQMYGMVTKQAFQFCLTYKRNTEFRRLCEILRNQLLTLRKCAISCHCALSPRLLGATTRRLMCIPRAPSASCKSFFPLIDRCKPCLVRLPLLLGLQLLQCYEVVRPS
jgi:hypothetical protein